LVVLPEPVAPVALAAVAEEAVAAVGKEVENRPLLFLALQK